MPVAGTQTSSADSGLGGSVGRRIRRPDLEIVSERRHGSKAGYSSGWLGSTPEGLRPQIRALRAGGSLALASSTPATQLLLVTSGLATGSPVGVGNGLGDFPAAGASYFSDFVRQSIQGHLFSTWIHNSRLCNYLCHRIWLSCLFQIRGI